MSDFGRTFRVNAQRGTDHAWGNNHLVLGGAVKDQTVFGAYPDVTLGGVQDTDTNGRWIPTTAVEEYIGADRQMVRRRRRRPAVRLPQLRDVDDRAARAAAAVRLDERRPDEQRDDRPRRHLEQQRGEPSRGGGERPPAVDRPRADRRDSAAASTPTTAAFDPAHRRARRRRAPGAPAQNGSAATSSSRPGSEDRGERECRADATPAGHSPTSAPR